MKLLLLAIFAISTIILFSGYPEAEALHAGQYHQIPHAPSNFEGTINGNVVTLTWSVPNYQGFGDGVDAYGMWYKLSSDDQWVQNNPIIPHTQLTRDFTLPTDESYDFVVFARNLSSDTAWGFATDIVTLSPVPITNPPDAPTNLVASATNHQVTLNWNAPSNTGSSSITDYVVKYQPPGSSRWLLPEDGTFDATSFSVNFTRDGTYNFKVFARSNDGTSIGSSTASVTLQPVVSEGHDTESTNDQVLPPRFPNLELEIIQGDNSLGYNWSFASSLPAGYSIWGYIVQFESRDGESPVINIRTNTDSSSMGIPDLIVGNSYHFQIQPIFIIGDDRNTRTMGNPVSENTVHAQYVAPVITPTEKKSSSGCSDCIPPTLGLDQNFNRVVDNGFTFADQSVQVVSWHTPFPLINSTVGQVNYAQFKIYENLGIANLQMAQYGIGAQYYGQPLNYLEALIEIPLLSNGTSNYLGVGEINVISEDNLIEAVTATAHVGACQENSVTSCGIINLYYTYREAPVYPMVVVNVMDKNRNSQSFFFNDGVNVTGDSLNPSKTEMINAKFYTEIDKVSNVWESDGIEYKRTSDTNMERITPDAAYVCNDTPLDEIMNGGGRDNCHWREAYMSHYWK